jgi:hypothetical protein
MVTDTQTKDHGFNIKGSCYFLEITPTNLKCALWVDMEVISKRAAGASEISVVTYQNTRCHNPYEIDKTFHSLVNGTYVNAKVKLNSRHTNEPPNQLQGAKSLRSCQ